MKWVEIEFVIGHKKARITDGEKERDRVAVKMLLSVCVCVRERKREEKACIKKAKERKIERYLNAIVCVS